MVEEGSKITGVGGIVIFFGDDKDVRNLFQRIFRI